MSDLTTRGALELIGHEAIAQEAYQDSKKIWTWSIGITNASGHAVYPRYKDNPQSIEQCLAVFIWLLNQTYIPAVLKAFNGHALNEAQFAAALSFHYNTGAILSCSWVKLFLSGDIAAARTSFMTWKNPPEIVARRQAECDLFFDAKWSNDGMATIYPVLKPSYTPDFRHGKRVDITDALKAAMAA